MLKKIEKELKKNLNGKILILGIGNILRRDDGFGSVLANRLKGKVSVIVIDAQGCPENYLNRLVDEKPDTILILDAADFKGRPAEIELFNPYEASNLNNISTHNLPINLLIEFLEHNCNAQVLFLALQPKAIGLGQELSIEVKEKINLLEELLLRILPS
jgi:hydrogenase 3 maturation protease